MGLDTIFKLSVVMSMVDNLTRPMGRVTSQVTESTARLQQMEQKMWGLTKAGAAMVGLGSQVTAAAVAPVKATFATQQALGELASLGVRDLGRLEAAAKDFSDTWAGTTKAEFISAAYDIKSGVASLTDEGVAQFTRLAGITAKATKASVAEMTSLFATGYGIYKDYYSNLTDMQFGEMFAGGIAQSVKQFKTTGSGMAQAIQNLGGSATTANVPLEEQLSILGMLQATMTGAEAGTKYRAFLRSAARGGQELGLSFTDANNQLLAMPDILERLRGKFGDTMDAAEKLQLQRAFGDTEAVALIDLMYSKTGDLRANIEGMSRTLSGGAGAAMEMAGAINSTRPAQYELIGQHLQNIRETVGNALAPTISEMLGVIDNVITKVGAWAEKNQGLVKAIMLLVLGLGGFLTAAGGTALVVGGLGLAVIKGAQVFKVMVVSIGAFRGALSAAIPAVGSFTAALLSNPITWVILGIVALIAVIALLWRNWDKVTGFLRGAWDGFCGVVSAGVGWIMGGLRAVGGFFGDAGNAIMAGFDWVKGGVQGVIGWIGERIAWFGEAGRKIIDTLVGGIKAVAMKPVEAIKGIFTKIRRMLPFSDAKEGPLSHLTLSGQRTITTLVQGMERESELPAKTVARSLELVEALPVRAAETAISEGGFGPRLEPVRRSAARKETAERTKETHTTVRGEGTVVRINHLELKIGSLKDLDQLKRLLAELAELSNADAADEDGGWTDDGLVPQGT